MSLATRPPKPCDPTICIPPKMKVCPQVCPPPYPAPIPLCLPKPTMRNLHYKQTMGHLKNALILGMIGGACYYFFIARRRIHAYRRFYDTAEFEDWADEMARKGLFQAVPQPSLLGPD